MKKPPLPAVRQRSDNLRQHFPPPDILINGPQRRRQRKPEDFERINSYVCVDTDDDAFPAYYGFINDVGEWYIMQVQEVGGTRYYRVPFSPLGLYGTAWTNRTSQTYLYWDSML